MNYYCKKLHVRYGGVYESVCDICTAKVWYLSVSCAKFISVYVCFFNFQKYISKCFDSISRVIKSETVSKAYTVSV